MFFKKFKRDKFQRVVAGLGWPSGVRPGCFVIVGEKPREDKTQYHLLEEFETGNLTALVNKAFDFQERYKLDATYTDRENRAMLDFAYRVQPGLNFSSAPYADSPDSLIAYVVLIQTLTSPGEKRLHFNKRSNLPRLLIELSPEKVRGSAGEYPHVAALGYAVSALEAYAFCPNPRVEVSYVQSIDWEMGNAFRRFTGHDW